MESTTQKELMAHFGGPKGINTRFDAFEIHPCCLLLDEFGNDIGLEQCNHDDPNIECWSLYGHLAAPDGGLEWLGDYETEEGAETALEKSPLRPIVTRKRVDLWTCPDCDTKGYTPFDYPRIYVTCTDCGAEFLTNTHIEN